MTTTTRRPGDLYGELVLPRVIDLLLGNEGMAPIRERALEGLHGTVLELGFGSGTNVGRYPPEVTRVLAVEPSAGARALAARRLARVPTAVDLVGLDGQRVDLPDACADDALSTWTLCTIPDVDAALGEVRRLLRPGGRFFFLEHGRSPDPGVRARQVQLSPLQQRIAGGCHLERDITALVQDAGFTIERVAEFDIAGPKVMSHLFCGVAVPA